MAEDRKSSPGAVAAHPSQMPSTQHGARRRHPAAGAPDSRAETVRPAFGCGGVVGGLPPARGRRAINARRRRGITTSRVEHDHGPAPDVRHLAPPHVHACLGGRSPGSNARWRPSPAMRLVCHASVDTLSPASGGCFCGIASALQRDRHSLACDAGPTCTNPWAGSRQPLGTKRCP